MADTIAHAPKTNPVRRLFARSMTPFPTDRDCWSLDGDRLTVLFDRAPELLPQGGSIQLEDGRLPERLLVVHGMDGNYYAYANHCACGGFRIDPVPGEKKLRCCTLMKATYTYAGDALSAHVDKGLTVFPVKKNESFIEVDLSSPQIMNKLENALESTS